MSALSIRFGWLPRMLAVAALLCGGMFAHRTAQAAGIRPEAALVRVLTVRPMEPAWFAPAFLAQVSVAQVQQVVDQVTAQLGAYKRETPAADGSFTLQFQDGTVKALIALDAAGRIAGLQFTGLKVATAAPPTHGRSPAATAAAIDTLLRQRTHDHRFSGAVLVALHGKVLLRKGYGPADLARGIANTSATEFRIASISKQFAAMSILQLQEAGKLSIGDRLCVYMRSCPAAWAPITLRMLLTHTSGMPTNGVVPGYVMDFTKPIAVVDGVELLKRIPLDRAPGSTFEYSNANFDLLGYVVSRVTGLPYSTYVQQHIFNPLHLLHTGFDSNYPDPSTHATGYSAWATTAPYIDLSWFFAAGALYSTVGDLWRWDQALQSNTLLTRKDTTDMFAAHAMMCAKNCDGYDRLDYGYGWIRGAIGGRPIIWHNGELPGFVAMNEFLPQQGITIVLLSNLESSGASGALGLALAKIMLGRA